MMTKTNESQKQSNKDLEPFYQVLEDDSKLLEEALEILLGMANYEPKLVKKLALIIKDDSPNLYNEIGELYERNQDKGNKPSCCG